MTFPTPIVSGESVRLPRMSWPAGLDAGQIVFLVLVWLFALVLPLLGPALPLVLHGMLSDSYGTFALALAITWKITDKRK